MTAPEKSLVMEMGPERLSGHAAQKVDPSGCPRNPWTSLTPMPMFHVKHSQPFRCAVL